MATNSLVGGRAAEEQGWNVSTRYSQRGQGLWLGGPNRGHRAGGHSRQVVRAGPVKGVCSIVASSDRD